jgi:hypothetical protein
MTIENQRFPRLIAHDATNDIAVLIDMNVIELVMLHHDFYGINHVPFLAGITFLLDQCPAVFNHFFITICR